MVYSAEATRITLKSVHLFIINVNCSSTCNANEITVQYARNFNPLRTVVAYTHQGNKYFTVRKQITITLPAFTL